MDFIKNNMKMILPVISLSIALAGCNDRPMQHKHIAHSVQLKEYRHKQDDGQWMYWYIINDNNTYYTYSTRTEVSSFKGLSFNRISANQVKEVEEETQEVDEDTIQPELEPAEVVANQQAEAMTNEGGLATPETNSDTSTSSSDSGSSSSDSGGSSSD